MAGNTLISVTGSYTDAADVPAKGTVTFVPVVAEVDTTPDPRQVTQNPVVAPLDEGGKLSATVIASDDPGWRQGPVAYQITEKITGLERIWFAHILGPGPVDLSDLTPVPAPPAVAIVPLPGPTGPAGTPGGPPGPTGPASTVAGPTGPAGTPGGPTGPTGPPGAGGVPIFVNVAARDAALPAASQPEGTMAFVQDSQTLSTVVKFNSGTKFWRNLVGVQPASTVGNLYNYGGVGVVIGNGAHSDSGLQEIVGVGNNAWPKANNSVALGSQASAGTTGAGGATAVGSLCHADAGSSIALGYRAVVDAAATGSVAIGSLVEVTAPNQIVLGKTHDVVIPGTLTVAGVPVVTATEVETLRDELADLRARLEAHLAE
jgi:hypothetical protein